MQEFAKKLSEAFKLDEFFESIEKNAISSNVWEIADFAWKNLKDLKHKGYSYHNWEHTIDVFEVVTQIAKQKGLGDDKIEILQISAMLHDVGFVKDYKEHEHFSSLMAEEILTMIGVSQDMIKVVQECILATMPLSDSKSELDNIIKTADIDNMCREDFFMRGIFLKEELENVCGLTYTNQAWYANTLNFMKMLEKKGFLQSVYADSKLDKFYHNMAKLKETVDICESSDMD